MRARIFAVLAALAPGCTLVVGGDPRLASEDEAGGVDAATGPEAESKSKDAITPDVAPPLPEASTCDAGGCQSTKATCKKACSSTANVCNAACDDDKTCKKLCQQQLEACNEACVAACNACVSGCGPACSP